MREIDRAFLTSDCKYRGELLAVLAVTSGGELQSVLGYARWENLLKILLPRKTRQLPQMVRIT